MRLPLAFAVLLLASAQALASEVGATDDLSYWSDWSDGDQVKEELPLPLEHFLQRMARRPRPQQFFGLMGKRDAGYGPISHKKLSRYETDSTQEMLIDDLLPYKQAYLAPLGIKQTPLLDLWAKDL